MQEGAMRVLFTTQPGLGHLHPLVSLAGALRDAGHEVRFTCPASFGSHVRAAGFAHVPAGLDWEENGETEAFPWRAIASPAMVGRYIMTYVFAYATARLALPDLLALARDWQPDLVVRETEEFAGCVAAERWGIPHVSVQAALTNTYTYRWALAAQMETLRDSVGLPPDLLVEMPYRYLHLAFLPPALHPPEEPLAPTARFLRPVPFDRSGEEVLPDWVATLPDRPTIYATLGTVFNFARPVFAAILDGLRNEPVNLILTVGRNVNPDTFGPQPENVRIARYIPQTLLMPRCDVVVAHGGTNTVLAALLAGKPLMLLPQGSDHFSNAQGCEALGVGRSVVPGEQTPEAIREAVRAVLGEGAYREGAERARAAIAAMPGPEEVVTLLERVAAEKQPLLTPD
jgi:UDP:flavonoid glycosyltransferase YjiC (YdhE family)